MYQSFAVTARPEQGPPRLQALRAELAVQGLDGFLIPRADAHQGEYVAPRDDRLVWLTGFTGSAGFCAVLPDIAGVFIDGRYRTQIKTQVADVYTAVPWPETGLADWLIEQMPSGGVIGFDPWLHTAGQIEQLTQALAGTGITLNPTDNMVDAIWNDQPGPAMEPADSLCWLLNIRGADIHCNPVAQGFAVLHADARVDLFMADAKLDDVRDHLGAEVTAHDPDSFLTEIAKLTGPVRMEKSSVPFIVADTMGDSGTWGDDPCALPKACKNPAEIDGSASAHLRDGAAVVELLAWLDAQAPGTVSEIDVVTKLEAYRRNDNALQNISFDTIAGTGPNGAINHYHVTEDTDLTLADGHLLVLDSGGQYLDGTTDITRTIPIGAPGADECAAFTRVLMGMIAVSRLRWPAGLAGRDIEAIGRAPLWYAHQDFDHGLGHGVGAYLSVHEGPQRLSRASHVPLQPGMILSNEPGYYREGAFGIRIENLLVVEPATAPAGGDAQRAMLSWRTLTFVPIDRRLILPDEMDKASRDWLNAYHTEVLEKIGPRVSPDALIWLKNATAPI